MVKCNIIINNIIDVTVLQIIIAILLQYYKY